jgi:hypothetical protein
MFLFFFVSGKILDMLKEGAEWRQQQQKINFVRKKTQNVAIVHHAKKGIKAKLTRIDGRKEIDNGKMCTIILLPHQRRSLENSLRSKGETQKELYSPKLQYFSELAEKTQKTHSREPLRKKNPYEKS